MDDLKMVRYFSNSFINKLVTNCFLYHRCFRQIECPPHSPRAGKRLIYSLMNLNINSPLKISNCYLFTQPTYPSKFVIMFKVEILKVNILVFKMSARNFENQADFDAFEVHWYYRMLA